MRKRKGIKAPPEALPEDVVAGEEKGPTVVTDNV